MTKVYETEATKRDQELQKFRLRYEMMARMELNTKLAEVNRFLEKRATDLDENNKAKDVVTEEIQKDLSNRLSQSKDELIRIKDQMRGMSKENPKKKKIYIFLPILDTERGIQGLQRQLETRERELEDERSKRRVLEKHFEKKTEKRLINDIAKRPRAAYF